MRPLLDRNKFSSRTNGRVAARRVTGLIIKRLGCTAYWRFCDSVHIGRQRPPPIVAEVGRLIRVALSLCVHDRE